VNAEAMKNLKSLPNGLNVPSILAISDSELNQCIQKVGFHKRKTMYLKQTAKILHDEYQDDIPDHLDGLMALPGVGPKMAYLCMQAAWGQ
jgi:endonuclease-3